MSWMRNQLSVRLPHELNAAVAARAKREARRPSDIVRLALQDYLKEAPGAARDALDRVRGQAEDSSRPSSSRGAACGPDRVREAGGAPAWGESENTGAERTVLLRHVPEELHQALEARAARERLSLSDYVLDILKRREFLERLKSRSRVALGLSAAGLIREDRDKR